MNLTKENSLMLYHYCTSITDELRPLLNTPETIQNINKEYWVTSLTKFKRVIDDVLNIHSDEFTKIFTSILTGVLSNETLTMNKKDISEGISIAYNSAIAVYNDLKQKRGE